MKYFKRRQAPLIRRPPDLSVSMHLLRHRSESFNVVSSAAKDHETRARDAASPPSLPASSLQHRSRSLGDAALTVAATTGNGGGGYGDSASLEKRARIGYLIMLSGVDELHKTKRLLKVQQLILATSQFTIYGTTTFPFCSSHYPALGIVPLGTRGVALILGQTEGFLPLSPPYTTSCGACLRCSTRIKFGRSTVSSLNIYTRLDGSRLETRQLRAYF